MIDSSLFESIVTPNEQPHDAKYINCVPKIQVTDFINISNGRDLLLVPISIIDAIRPILSNIHLLNHSKRLFYVNSYYMSILINDIIKTNGKYVYPMAFVNYLKQTLSINEKVNFDNELLLYLRIWSNQIREISNKNDITNYRFMPEYVSVNCQAPLMRTITYIGYTICCELLYYYKYAHEK